MGTPILGLALVVSGLLTGASAAQAQAAQPIQPVACTDAIEQLRAEWDAIGLSTSAKPGGRVTGRGSHAHVQAEVSSMGFHFQQATADCRQNKDHEALLHVDLIRAWLKLPEEFHPVEHQALPR